MVLTLWLVAYTFRRYNGGDHWVYFQAMERLARGESPYFTPTGSLPFRYFPATLPLFALWAKLPIAWQHTAFFALSVAAFFRTTLIWAQLFAPAGLGTKRLSSVLYYAAPWLLLSQGAGAQFESGNINLLLIWLCSEGVLAAEQERWAWATTMMGIAAIFKPHFAAVPALMMIPSLFRRPKLWKAVLSGSGICMGLCLLLGLAAGWGRSAELLHAWGENSQEFYHCSLVRTCTAINFSVYSFFYERLGLSTLTLLWFFVLPCTAIAIAVSFRIPRIADRGCLGFLYLFFITPASYPYMILAFLPATYRLMGETLRRRSAITTVSCISLVLAMVVLNPSILGRDLYNRVIVPERLQTWIALPFLIGMLWILSRETPRHEAFSRS